MFRYTCLNPISQKGLELFSDQYTEVKELAAADAVLVRSAKMTELEIPDSVLAIGRAGAGVNNIPVADCAEKGIVVFNTPGANANGVKELVLAGMLLVWSGLKITRKTPTSENWLKSRKNSLQAVRLAVKSWELSVWVRLAPWWQMLRML